MLPHLASYLLQTQAPSRLYMRPATRAAPQPPLLLLEAAPSCSCASLHRACQPRHQLANQSRFPLLICLVHCSAFFACLARLPPLSMLAPHCRQLLQQQSTTVNNAVQLARVIKRTDEHAQDCGLLRKAEGIREATRANGSKYWGRTVGNNEQAVLQCCQRGEAAKTQGESSLGSTPRAGREGGRRRRLTIPLR